MSTDIAQILNRLPRDGVAGVTIAWADNNGIPRSRTVPVAALADVLQHGQAAPFSTPDSLSQYRA